MFSSGQVIKDGHAVDNNVYLCLYIDAPFVISPSNDINFIILAPYILFLVTCNDGIMGDPSSMLDKILLEVN